VQGQPNGESTEFFLRMYMWAPVLIFGIGIVAWGLMR